MIDLHIHTNVSDGQYAPAETVRLAARAGAVCLAITDHDRVSGLKEGSDAAEQIGADFIPGIEISVRGNRELHILGYYIDYGNASLIEACENFIRLREQRGARIFDFLSRKGVPLTEGQVRRHVPGDTAGRPHFARAMVEAGYVSSIQEAFDKYLSTPEFDSVERMKPAASEGLRMILGAGGIPVLAHPALLKLDDAALEALIAELAADGLQGIECYYTAHTPGQTARYLELAEQFGLLATCGSDFHGEQAKPGFALCGPSRDLPASVCDKIIEDLKRKKR